MSLLVGRFFLSKKKKQNDKMLVNLFPSKHPPKLSPPTAPKTNFSQNLNNYFLQFVGRPLSGRFHCLFYPFHFCLKICHYLNDLLCLVCHWLSPFLVQPVLGGLFPSCFLRNWIGSAGSSTPVHASKPSIRQAPQCSTVGFAPSWNHKGNFLNDIYSTVSQSWHAHLSSFLLWVRYSPHNSQAGASHRGQDHSMRPASKTFACRQSGQVGLSWISSSDMSRATAITLACRSL